ncbi:MAG: hypothetical protein SF162_10230 [bacterium]|nr:hypothetical protein [bacterium]
MMQIVLCVACDGYGTTDDDGEGLETVECAWCGGAGYVYRDEAGVDRIIPDAEYGRVADQLEKLEAERLRGLGYTGTAKKPWEQDIRK